MPNLSAPFVIKQPPPPTHFIDHLKRIPETFRFLRIPRHKCSTGCLIKKTNPHRNTEKLFLPNPILSVCIPPCFFPAASLSHVMSRAPARDECKRFPSLYLFSQIKAGSTSPSVCTPSVCPSDGLFLPTSPAVRPFRARRSTGSLPGLRRPYQRLEIQCESDMRNRQ